MVGKKKTESHCKNISVGRIGIQFSDQTRKKQSESAKLRGSHPQEVYDKIVLSRSWYSHSETTKQKQSTAAANETPVYCPHCSKFGRASNMSRWHFDNCKILINSSTI
jgi:hypothetical protein